MFVLFGIIAVVAISGSSGQQRCETPSGGRGSCVSLKHCAPLLTILRSAAALEVQNRNTLVKSQCGLDVDVPMVCCPTDDQVTRVTEPSTVATDPSDIANHPNLRLLNNDHCGTVTELKIFHGNRTTVLEFPWMALIGFKVRKSPKVEFKCGGTVISKRYILTAAHCVTGLGSGLELSTVRLGDHDLDKERDCDYEKEVEIVCADKYQDFSIERVHFHSRYRATTTGYDIALIRLDRDADFRPNVNPICLPIGSAATMKSDKGIVTGWGLTESKRYSETLLKVKLPIVSNNECARTYKDRYNLDIFDPQLCAGGKNGMDSCNGDSGGPLQFPDSSNGSPQFIQYGIVSYGPRECGTPEVPGVYTRVASYMDWILDTIQD